MSKPPVSEPSKNSSTTQIVVATIGGVAVIGAALFANWEKIVSRRSPESPPASASMSSPGIAQSSGHPTSQGSQSPVVSGVSGNVTISIGTPTPGSATDRAANTSAASFAGNWEARVTDSDGEYLSGFEIRISGETATGSALFRGQERKLRDGKIVGNELRFSTEGTGPNGASELRQYRGLLAGEEVHFTLNIEASDKKHRTLEFTATR